jgi:plastocyanin
MRRLLIALAAAGTLAASAPAGAATIDIRIDRTSFTPASVTITAGDTVRWTNRDRTTHQVVSDTGAFVSPILGPGQSYSFTFRNAGTYRYRDALRPTMRAVVRVEGPPPSVTLGATAPVLVFGAETHVQGAVSSKRPGEAVAIFHAPYGQGSYTPLVTLTTGAEGVFDLVVRPALLTSYLAQYRGVSSGEVLVQVRPKITLLPAPPGRFIARVTGGKSFAGRFVYLQRRSAFGQWVSVARYRLGVNSGKLFKVPKRPGVSRYRIFMTVNQAGPGYLESWSGTQTVRRR